MQFCFSEKLLLAQIEKVKSSIEKGNSDTLLKSELKDNNKTILAVAQCGILLKKWPKFLNFFIC